MTINATAPHTEDLVNTVTMTANEVDRNPTDNQYSTVVNVNSVQVTTGKTASSASLSNGEVTTYTVTITNAEGSAQNVRVLDTLSSDTDNRIPGSNGGYLDFVTGSTSYTCGNSSCLTDTLNNITGAVETSSGVLITGMPAGSIVNISYQMRASYDGIPTDSSSTVTNEAYSLVESASWLDENPHAINTISIHGKSGGNGGRTYG